jgi:hypothetical protein
MCDACFALITRCLDLPLLLEARLVLSNIQTKISSHVPIYIMFLIAKLLSAAFLTYPNEMELLSTRMAQHHENVMHKTLLGNSCIILICTKGFKNG